MAGKWKESNVKRDKFGRFVKGSGNGLQSIHAPYRGQGGPIGKDTWSSKWKNGKPIFQNKSFGIPRNTITQPKQTSTYKNGRRVTSKPKTITTGPEKPVTVKGKVVYKNGKRVKDTRKKA